MDIVHSWSIQRNTANFQAALLSEVGYDIDLVRGPVGSIRSPIFNWFLPIDVFVSKTEMKIEVTMGTKITERDLL